MTRFIFGKNLIWAFNDHLGQKKIAILFVAADVLHHLSARLAEKTLYVILQASLHHSPSSTLN